jgi:hypothetical protein
MAKSIPRWFAILVAAACVLGVILATPSMTPTARADTLPNGYSITCTPNGDDVICNISGCPRVHADEAGDVVHVISEHDARSQRELSKGCNSDVTDTFANNKSMTISVQGCRKHFPAGDDCGDWSDYQYIAPAQAVAPAQQAPSAPAAPVNCPQGSPTPQAASLGQCAPVPPINCPPGSAADTVPAGQQCAAPTDAVAMSIKQSGVNAHAAITNDSKLPAQCVYTATKKNGLGPQTVNKSINVDPDGTNTITDMLWPPPFTTYNAVVKCTVTYNGTQTVIGQASQTVSG